MEKIIENKITKTTAENSVEIRPIEVITDEINFYKNVAGSAVLEIGKRLNEAKAQLQHGEWTEWLKEKVEFSEASAQRFMRLAKEYSNPSPVTDLGASKALLLLAIPEVDREEFLNKKHIVNGEEKSVSEMSKRELEKVIKERDEHKERAEHLENKVEDLKASIADLEKEKQELENELQELRDTPVEVNCEVTEEQKEEIRSAVIEERKAEEEKLQQKINSLNQKKEKTESRIKDLEAQIKQLEENNKNIDELHEKETLKLTEKYEREVENLNGRIEELEKKLLIASSAKMAEFKIHFKNAQNSINNMLSIITEETDTTEKEKLKNVLLTFCNAVSKNCDSGETSEK